MAFTDIMAEILAESKQSMTPREIVERIKVAHPECYDTEAQRRTVSAGHHSSVDHALLAQVYTAARASDRFEYDSSTKPVRVALASESIAEEEFEASENPDAEVGIVYVLRTGVFTEDRKEIVKIGVTTGAIDDRIRQLYTTGVPFRFTVLKLWQITGFYELERALHKLLVPYRISGSREFFSADCLPYASRIAEIHAEIQKSG